MDNNAFHCKQSRNCFSRVPRRLENIREIERTLYLESEDLGGVLALVITRRVTLGSHLPPRSLSFLTQESYEEAPMGYIRRSGGLFVCFSHSVKA